jgi:hypothetical protein
MAIHTTYVQLRRSAGNVSNSLTWRLGLSMRARLVLIVIAGLSAIPRSTVFADVSRALLALAVLAGLSSIWSP